MSKICLYAAFCTAFIFGCSSAVPLTKEIPVTSGPIAKVNFDSTPVNQIYEILIILHQYENCDFVERGRVILAPAASHQSYNFRSGSLLFAEITATVSWYEGRLDAIFPLEDNAEYTLKITFDEKDHSWIRATPSLIRKHDGQIQYTPVKVMTLREGLKTAMKNCRKNDMAK